MNMKSKKVINNERLIINIPFDLELIKDVKRDEDDNSVITFMYDLENVTTYFPVPVSCACFVAQLTHDNLYLSASVYTDSDNSDTECPYCLHNVIDCSAFLDEAENHRLLMALIRVV